MDEIEKIDFDEVWGAQEEMWERKGAQKTANSIATSVSGALNCNAGPYRYRIDSFSGDLVFIDKDFLASGSCLFRNINQNRVNTAVWALEYTASFDSVILTVNDKTATFSNVSSIGSDANLRYSIPESKVLFVVRKEVGFPAEFRLHPGSHIIVQA